MAAEHVPWWRTPLADPSLLRPMNSTYQLLNESNNEQPEPSDASRKNCYGGHPKIGRRDGGEQEAAQEVRLETGEGTMSGGNPVTGAAFLPMHMHHADSWRLSEAVAFESSIQLRASEGLLALSAQLSSRFISCNFADTKSLASGRNPVEAVKHYIK